MTTFISDNDCCSIELLFSWDPYKDLVVKDVLVDDNSIEIVYEEQAIMIDIYGNDCRSKKDMDSEKCNRDPEGCCFEHSTCGYDKCLEHNPLQQISIECDTKLLLNKQIVNFIFDNEDYSPYVLTFYFVLSNGNKVPLSINNNLTQYTVTVYVNEYY